MWPALADVVTSLQNPLEPRSAMCGGVSPLSRVLGADFVKESTCQSTIMRRACRVRWNRIRDPSVHRPNRGGALESHPGVARYRTSNPDRR
jgi:hypothetical protein